MSLISAEKNSFRVIPNMLDIPQRFDFCRSVNSCKVDFGSNVITIISRVPSDASFMGDIHKLGKGWLEVTPMKNGEEPWYTLLFNIVELRTASMEFSYEAENGDIAILHTELVFTAPYLCKTDAH